MVSIIVPVYNVEKYLDRCVESILKQTYTDFELILVDDGSTDSSSQICDEWEKKDNRIKVIHKQNGGLSDARNAGLLTATGDLVNFIDSDDYVDKSYLKILYGLRKKYNADVSSVGCKFVDNDGNELFGKVRTRNIRELSNEKAFEQLLLGKINSSSGGILLPIIIAKENFFPYGKFWEDEFITPKYYLTASKVVISNEQLYYYVQNDGSIMHKADKKKIEDAIESADNYVEICRDMSDRRKNLALYRKHCLYKMVFRFYPEIKQYPDLFEKVQTFVKEYSWKFIWMTDIPLKTRVRLLLHKIKLVITCGNEF